MNVSRTSLLERLLVRAIGDAGLAESIVGDLAEEGARWRAAHLAALVLRFTLRRSPRSVLPVPRSKPMSTLLQDVRYAVRVLLRQPGFSAVVVLTLAIGLGANAAVFAMIDGLLFRPLPTADVEGMAQIFETNVAQNDDRDGVSPPDFFDWQQQARSFDALVATEYWEPSLSTEGQDPEQVIGRRVSAPFFETLRVRLAQGRSFAAQEETIGFHRVVVVSHRLWQRRWAASPSLVGSTVQVDRQPYTVVGIAPDGFDYPAGTNLWAPITFTAENRTQRGRRYLEAIARLKPGVTIDAAQREMQGITARIVAEHPATHSGYGARLMPLSSAMLDLGMPQVLGIWQLAVSLVLLIAGANVANLLMVRGTTRHRELALRFAVGASRWRVIRQLVVESLVLSVAGVLLAVPIAAGGIRLIKGFMPPEIARWILGWQQFDIDGRLLGATMVAGVIAGVVFGILPALRATRTELSSALKEGARTSSGGRRRALQAFVVAQVALALALLVSAGLSTRGAVRLLTQYDGYDPAGVMTFALSLPTAAYPDEDARLRFYERVLERMRGLAQVESSAFASAVPFGFGSPSRAVEVEGRSVATASERPQIDTRTVTPAYFDVIRASVIRGRRFAETDRADAPKVAIVDELMAERLWPGVDPIGRRFRPALVENAPWLTVVGVTAKVKHNWFMGYRPTYFVPYAQSPIEYGTLAVRVRGDEAAIAPAIRQIVRELDPNLPLADVHSLLRLRSLRTVGMQFVAALMASFAGIGLFLSAIGIYGVMAYSVSQRTREIGVRIALGATNGSVMGMTIRDAVTLAAAGIVIGLIAAFGLAKLMVANLFGVVQMDAWTFAVFAGILGVVALVAASVPARRATRVDPMIALRAD